MHWYWQNVGKDNYKLFFVIFQWSYGPWLMSEFCFHLISWEQIDEFWWNVVYAVLWPAHEILLNFSTELWPLVLKFQFLEIMNGFWRGIMCLQRFYFCFKCVLVLLAMHSSGELCCLATAHIIFISEQMQNCQNFLTLDSSDDTI